MRHHMWHHKKSTCRVRARNHDNSVWKYYKRLNVEKEQVLHREWECSFSTSWRPDSRLLDDLHEKSEIYQMWEPGSLLLSTSFIFLKILLGLVAMQSCLRHYLPCEGLLMMSQAHWNDLTWKLISVHKVRPARGVSKARFQLYIANDSGAIAKNEKHRRCDTSLPPFGQRRLQIVLFGVKQWLIINKYAFFILEI